MSYHLCCQSVQIQWRLSNTAWHGAVSRLQKKSWASHHCDRRQRRNVNEMDKTDSRDKDGRPGQNWTEVRTRNQQIQITKIYEIQITKIYELRRLWVKLMRKSVNVIYKSRRKRSTGKIKQQGFEKEDHLATVSDGRKQTPRWEIKYSWV